MRAALALAGMAAAMCGPPAHAQIDGPPEMRSDARAERVLADAAYCLVRGERSRARATALLTIPPATRESADATMALMKGASGCMPRATMMRMKMETLRGALAEQLYLASYRAAPASKVESIAPRPAWADAPAGRAYEVAQCAAQRDPIGADMLVRADRRSPQERAAVDRLLPALRGCDGGAKLDFTRTTIHGLVAEGLFKVRRVEAPSKESGR